MPWNEDLEPTSSAYKLASSDARVIRAVAGPGSGKSFAIKKRILRLLEEGANPEEILAITFTRTAARDLKKEISSLEGGGGNVCTRTLHSHALKILMQADVLGITGRTPRIVLEHEIKPALKDLELSEQYTLNQLEQLNNAYLAGWATMQEQTPGFATNETEKEFEAKLIEWMKVHRGLMIGEVIPVAMDFLRNNPGYPERSKYKYVLIDEYQDLNKCEQEFVKLLCDKASVVIVGDDDQSIYGFKNAHPEGIQQINTTYGEFDDVTFDECRRCPQQVTRMASNLISANTNRTLGELKPHVNNPNGKVSIIQWPDYEDEITGITNLVVQELNNAVIKPSEVLILTPRRLSGYQLRDKLTNLNVPVKSYFRESAIKNEKVKYAYSILNLLARQDDLIALRYLLGHGSADCRTLQYKKVQLLAQQHGLTVFDTLQKLVSGDLIQTGLTSIIRRFKLITEDLAKAQSVLAESPEKLFESNFIIDANDAFDFAELISILTDAIKADGTQDFKDASKFDVWLENIFAQVQENLSTPEEPEDTEHVRIMSLHASKGLGAKLVILCSMVDGLVPRINIGASAEEAKRTIEENRRLFYVAVTRCKSSHDYEGRLVISSFLRIHRNTAVQIGFGDATRTNPYFSAFSTRYLKDFGTAGPTPVSG